MTSHSTQAATSGRILSIDVLRGLTIVGMILVNSQSGPEVFAPLRHVDWFGLSPADLVFPFFMFIMGVTTYLSLRHFGGHWSAACAIKIVRRAVVLVLLCWGIDLLFKVAGGQPQPLQHVRFMGVLTRFGLCYGVAATLAMSVRARWLPWIAAALLVGYYVLLIAFNGFAHDGSNFLAVTDQALFGVNHVFQWDVPDPESFLSNIPAVAHVLIGYSVGRSVLRRASLAAKVERLFVLGTMLGLAGWLLMYACPVSKKLWSPTFVLLTCGLASLVLGLLTWAIDSRGARGRWLSFFDTFGVNPLALYVFSELVLIPLTMMPIGGATLCSRVVNVLVPVVGGAMASLIWSFLVVLLCWLVGRLLAWRKVFIKI